MLNKSISGTQGHAAGDSLTSSLTYARQEQKINKKDPVPVLADSLLRGRQSSVHLNE